MAPPEARSQRRRAPAAAATEKRRASSGKARPANGTVHVFISYAKSDHTIAIALREEIIEINHDRIECFLDSETIESGEGWEGELEAALKVADWLVCIYTGEQSEFCGYEIGVFTQGKALEKSAGNSRLVCLHDVADYPQVFRAHQNRFIEFPPERLPTSTAFDETGFYERSKLAKFFEDFCRYQSLYVAHDGAESKRQWQEIIRKAKRITEAFRAARGNDVRTDTPTQLSIELTVSCKPDQPLAEIGPEAQVKGTFQSFGLFGLMPPMEGEQLPTAAWADVRAACRSPYSGRALWIERLERDMLNAAGGRALCDSEATFLSKTKTYRAILFRHLRHWDGTHRFGIVFVETLPRQFIGDQNTSLILAGLVVASRFRFAYLEQPERITAQFDDALSDSEFDGNYRQFLYDLERMQHESMELGLTDPMAFLNAFGPSRRGIAEGFLAAWKEARQALDAGLPPTLTGAESRARAKAAVLQFLTTIEAENARFLKIALEAYREELDVQLRRRP